MAVNETSICNAALIEIGGPTITSLTEDSEAARLCNERFEQTLDEELEKGEFSFSIYRAQLAALASAPVFGYTYQHQMPANPYCLRVLTEYDDNEFKVEGRLLLSDDTPLKIRYIGRPSDLSELSALFVRALSFRIASILAIPIRGSGQLRDRMWKEYELNFDLAESKDSQQGTPDEQADGSWLDDRGGI
jgi:hypothetical protein